jgi:DNA-directed RNA polymerase subunit RPC12/RpoP
MEKRQTFKCWNCQKTYTLFKGFYPQQKIAVACPYCGEEAVVDLTPYSPTPVFKGEHQENETGEESLQLPDVIVTEKK